MGPGLGTAEVNVVDNALPFRRAQLRVAFERLLQYPRIGVIDMCLYTVLCNNLISIDPA